MRAARWLLLLIAAPSLAVAAEYFVAPDGRDTADGHSPAGAWRTLARVNAAELAPGDVVRFRRGGLWRGQLLPRSGAPGAPVTYTAHGDGPKPVLQGSVALDAPDDWRAVAPGLWASRGPTPSDRPVLPVGSDARLGLYTEGGAEGRATSGPAGCTVRCDSSGDLGHHAQLSLAPFAIRAGQVYALRFTARCEAAFELPVPVLMKAGPPWSGYAVGRGGGSLPVGPEPVAVELLWTSAQDADDARITFFLGGVLPAGAALTIAELSLVECDGGDPLPVDVGNIILDHGARCAVKKWFRHELLDDLSYWYDQARHAVVIVSQQNPAERFASVELALDRHIIDQSSRHDVVYDGLALRYGGAHGIGGGNTARIVARELDISWIGGGELGTRVRFGNGIEFWAAAADHLVERCRLWEIYDAALTNQNLGEAARQANIVYRNNVIWNSEYSFEYWNRPAESGTENVRFVHNTCVNAGGGWGHAQRPDPHGRHLCFYGNEATVRGLEIAGNIIAGATDTAFDARWWPAEQARDARVLNLHHNLWQQPDGVMIRIGQATYTAADFARYQRELGQDAGSLCGDPRLRDPAALDFGLLPDSPGRDAGTDLGVLDDFHGRRRPVGARQDIGAFES